MNKESSNPGKQEILTFVVRLVGFAVSVAIIVAFFLPWLRIDGIAESRSGVALPVLVTSPVVEYLFGVAPVQTVVLIASPVVMLVFAFRVSLSYAKRKTAVASTAIVIALAFSVVYGTQGLVASRDSIQAGLVVVIALSIVLLVHQLLIKLRGRLLKAQKFPAIYRGLGIATGAGRYRWRDS